MLVGAIIGAVVVGVHIVSALINFAVHESVRNRITEGAVGAAVAYVSLFAIGGALIGRLSMLAARWPAYIVGGTLGGALVWSYLTATWAFTARASAMGPPEMSVAESALQGAGLGAIGGALLLLIVVIRRR
jgi:hypothetical protein